MPSIKTSGLKTIEGMEVEKIGKGNINFRIINEIIGMDTTIRFQYHIKAGTESLGIETEILEKFERSNCPRPQLKVIAKSIAGISNVKGCHRSSYN
ncbi:MAG: hypothetical protein IPG79_03365 [Saprospiraceae bacterium]|nr:hypothetical protein [Saprospiraceae bacterium]